jgi:hypothetical protein
MRTLTLILASLLASSLFAMKPDTTAVSIMGKRVVHIVEDTSATNVEIGPNGEFMVTDKADGDTVNIRIGKKSMEIITKDKNTHVNIETLEDFESSWDEDDDNSKSFNQNWEFDSDNFSLKKQNKKRRFDGHWQGIDFGGNQLWDVKYPTTLYDGSAGDFLATRPEKSFEFNFNFAEYSFGFNSYMGLVTGLGFNFNDYKLKNSYTVYRDEQGIIQPRLLPTDDLRKTKISTVYLHAPLLFEFQIPGQYDRMFVSGGIIGGVKLGQHTKTKIGSDKAKSRSDLNLSPVRWGYTARIGFEDVGLYATYYNTKFFEAGKGPEATPLTIGFTFTFD